MNAPLLQAQTICHHTWDHAVARSFPRVAACHRRTHDGLDATTSALRGSGEGHLDSLTALAVDTFPVPEAGFARQRLQN